jgi:DNA-binding NarL/FixJ family response regulator
MEDPGYAALIERCYCERSSDAEWVSALLDAARPLLDNGLGYGFSMQRDTERGPVQLLTEFRHMAFDDSLRAATSGDLIRMLGHPTRGLSFVLWSGVADRGQVSARTRDALHRIRIHVETGLRLRAFSAAEAVATISPDGRIDRNDARLAWQALISGRWSLAERIESDGKREYLAFENPPCSVAYRELTENERAAVDLCGEGLSSKHVAYALGIAESSVSRHLNLAALRLGFRDRTALVRFAGQVTRSGPMTSDRLASITQAERSVLQMICQGKSNRAIADARGASERTVANQVVSLLRKTGAPNRRVLIVIADSAMEEMTMAPPLAAAQTAEPSE